MSEVKNEIMKVDQLPIIRQSLAEISEEIKRKTAEALSMVCTEETVKYVKAYRAELNNQKKDLEARRIAIKKEVMKPYDEFEAIYKEMIIVPFASADDQLKVKIDETEDIVRTRHADEVRAHFESYLADFPQIDFLPFERLGLNITKSASVPALKQQCEEFINKVSDDLEMIALQPDGAEIMVEYIPTLNAAQAITTVAARKKAIEAQRAAAERTGTIDDFDAPDPFDDCFDPPTDDPRIYTGPAKARIEVTDTIERIDALFAFLREGRYGYREI